MLTRDKLDVYRRFQGDIDGWARSSHGSHDAGMTDSDWFVIEELRQGLALIASGQASTAFMAQFEQRLHAVTADEATRERLRALV
jgi:hypothetical protein